MRAWQWRWWWPNAELLDLAGDMLSAHSADAVRAAEQPLLDALPDGALMARAVAGLSAVCAARLGRVYGRRVAVLAGSGNNGGDALYAAARLAARGARVDALLLGQRWHWAAGEALVRAGGRLHPVDTATADARLLLDRADLVLDGLLGIGGRGGLREPASSLVAGLDPARVVAVDCPSGVDADTGAVPGHAVRAATTFTFGSYKPGLLVNPGAEYAGELVLVPIGLELPEPDLTALEAVDVAARMPIPDRESSKYTRGVLGLVAGSNAYPGAAVLSSGGAVRGGAGYVRFVSVAHPAELVRLRHPEVVVTEVEPGDAQGVLGAGRVQAWAVGPGMGTDEDSTAVVTAILATELPVLVDADAITIVANSPELLRRDAPTLVTPHEGEFVRLVGGALGQDEDELRRRLADDRLGTVRAAAAELGVTVLLKGTTTLVVDPVGRARVNTTGTGWLATAGSGDVLTGLAGSLLAGGLDPLDAGSVGAWIHGRAGSLAPPPVASLDLLGTLTAAWAEARDAGQA